MPLDSPSTPTQDHDISSPIWDCCITAVEVLFPGTPPDGDPVHACIEYDPSVCLWTTYIAVPGGQEAYTTYTKEDIKSMLDHDPTASESRGRTRGINSRRKRCEGRVCSVRVRYKNMEVFLDRDEKEPHHWCREDLSLSTLQIKDILSFSMMR